MKTTNHTSQTNLFNAISLKKNVSTYLMLLIVLFIGSKLNAQVSLTATEGTPTGSFTTIKTAFDAINLGTHKGIITITVYANTTESASAILNATGSGNANYSSVNIYPTTTGLSISGNLPSPLIDLNGADNVTIDGRVNADGAIKDLVITNTSNSGNGGTSTIRLYKGANNNMIKYCTIKGSSTDSNGGVIFLSATAASTGNTIDNNNITNADNANRPINVIYSGGAANTVTISNNYIYDFLSRISSSNGINLNSSTAASTISGNSFYEANTFSPTANRAYYYPIYINSDVAGFIVSGNYIGGNAPSCSGTFTKSNTAYSNFVGIFLNSVGTGTPSVVKGNTVNGIVWNNNNNDRAWQFGIAINAGDITLGALGEPNTIGSITGTPNMSFTFESSGNIFVPLYLSGSGYINCQYNNVGGITCNNTNSTEVTRMYCIYRGNNNVNAVISNNTIGSATSPITCTSPATGDTQYMIGIFNNNSATSGLTMNNNTVSYLNNQTIGSSAGYVSGILSYDAAAPLTITNNTIHDLTISNTTNGAGRDASLRGGIWVTTGYQLTVTNNTVYNLTNTNPTFNGYMYGIYATGGSSITNDCSGNTVYNISSTGTGSGPFIYGIYYGGGNFSTNTLKRNYIYGLSSAGVNNNCWNTRYYGIFKANSYHTITYSNNIISLGGNTRSTIYGIYEEATSGYGSSSSTYFNSIYISGSPTDGGLPSYAFYSAGNVPQTYKNNVFYNARSNNGTTGNHYSFYYANTPVSTSDYNDFYAPGTDGYIGFYNGNYCSTLAAWRTATGGEANSLNTNPLFANAGGTTAASYIPSALTLLATTGTGIDTDYAGTIRSATVPSMGAYEYSLASLATTTSATAITATTATSGGNITSDCGASVTARGVCWSTSSNPELGVNNFTTDGTGTGSFSSSITGLTGGTLYYVRSYATNSVGTGYGAQVSFTSAAPPPGNAMAFDGGNDFVNGGNNASVQISTGTLEAWIKTSDAGSWYRGIVTKQSAYGMFLLDNELTIYDWKSGAENKTGVYLNDNKWHHVAFSFQSGVVNGSSIYIDGIKTKTITYTISDQTVSLGIGSGSSPSPIQFFTGSIDEVRVWNTVRTQSELQSNMYNELGGNESGLVAYYNFNLGAAGGDNAGISSLNDLSSNGNNGTLTGFAMSGSSSNFVESYALVVPTPTDATSITGTGFTANWTAPATGLVSSYKLDVSTSSTFASYVTGYNGLDCGTNLSQVVSDLSHSTTYYYRVRADKTSVTGTGGYFRTPTTVETLRLPTIAATTSATNITATSATSGGNVTSDGGTSVSARGVCWGTNSNPELGVSNFTSNGIGTGSFTSSIADLTAGTVYYVRAYATNSVGTNYGDQVSFTYTNADKGLTDLVNPTISDVAVANGFKFTSNVASQTVHSVTVEAGGKLDLTNALTVSGDVNLKADNSGSFSANIAAPLTVSGTLNYIKTMDADRWYFMSFPCNVDVNAITQVGGTLGALNTTWYIKEYDGASRIQNLGTVSNWKSIIGTTLLANKGYIIGLNASKGKQDISFPLDKALVQAAESATRTISNTVIKAHGAGAAVAANHKGWNLVGQPFLSKFSGANVSGGVGGNNLTYMSVPIGISGATYSQSVKATYTNIEPFSAYFVQVDADIESSGISFATGGRHLAPLAVEVEVSDRVQLNFTTATGTDNTNLIMDDSQTTAYEMNKDLEKMIGTGTAQPQVYTQLGGINFAYNALPAASVNNLAIGFYTKTATATTISAVAMAPRLSSLLLKDNVTGTVTDLLISSYKFTPVAAGINNTRFSITAQRIPTEITVETEADCPTILINNYKLQINNLNGKTDVRVYDAIGRMVASKTTSNSTVEIPVNVAGMYTVLMEVGAKSWVRKVVVR
jgi:hypothetical protein